MAKSNLELQFEDACMSDVVECSKLGYYPHYFVELVREIGAVATAKKPIADPRRVPPGFDRLYDMKRLDMSVEACIVENPQFHPLFDPDEIKRCEQRLADYHYTPKVKVA